MFGKAVHSSLHTAGLGSENSENLPVLQEPTDRTHQKQEAKPFFFLQCLLSAFSQRRFSVDDKGKKFKGPRFIFPEQSERMNTDPGDRVLITDTASLVRGSWSLNTISY
jgi:hypothetical protein